MVHIDCSVIPSAARNPLLAACIVRSTDLSCSPPRDTVRVRVYYVYILASRSRTLYVGVTNDITRRVFEHKMHAATGFSARYRTDRLVHFEETSYVHAAITREKQIKSWRREKKLRLIESGNPTWQDLSTDWYDSLTADSSLRSE
jgi:putative endonuclease